MKEKFSWRKLLAKKWTFPALYMIAAALILTLMWVYQDPNEYPLTKDELGLEDMTQGAAETPSSEELLTEKLGEAVPVANTVEKMVWPVENLEEIQVIMEFFDDKATAEEMEGALVSYENELWPHNGIDIVSKDKDAFKAAAALSGKVTRAEKDPVVGYVVELQHDYGLTTIYSSLAELQISEGDEVKQGQILGTAGRNPFERDHGVHLHFEVRMDGMAMNPDLFFDQQVDEVIQRISEEQPDTEE